MKNILKDRGEDLMENGSRERKAIREKEEGKENIGWRERAEQMTRDRAPRHI